MVRDSVNENSLENVSPEAVQSTLPRLDLPQAAFESEDREEIVESLCTDETALRHLRKMDKRHLTPQGLKSQQERTLESQPVHLVILHVKTLLHLDQWITS